MPRTFIVANPTSGRGTGTRMIPIIKRLMDLHQINYSLAITEKPWHAVEITRQAVSQGYDTVVAAGGDGTINEVLNGLFQAQEAGFGKPALGVFCVGQGNDFAYSMGIPLNIEEAAYALAAGKTRPVDVGRLRGGLYPQGRIFGNGVGIGFDAVVDFESVKLAPLSGFVSYLVAALKTIMLYYRAPQVRIELDDETLTQPSLMVSIMNGRRMGGGFYMTPESLSDDGKFDLCIAGEVNRFEIFKVMLRFMRGTQKGHPAIQFKRSQHVTITALNGSLPAHADGETMALDATHLELEVLPHTIDLITNPKEVR